MNEDCMFCLQSRATIRARAGEGGLETDVRVCDRCWKQLKDPRTALPMLRGHLSLTLRGKGDQKVLDQTIQDFMGVVQDFRPRS